MNIVIEPDRSASWRRSSRCDTGSCVEVAVTDSAVAVRDSKDVSQPMLTFSRLAWIAFLAGLRTGLLGVR